MAAPDEEAAVLFDFLTDYYEDRDQGGAQPLSAYLRRFPGFEETIAREYLNQRDERSAGTGGGESTQDGQRVGPYHLLRQLGEGGQGAVFLAEDTRIARTVALKLLRQGFIGEDARARFRREAEVIARLDHPGVCRIYEADIDGEVPFLAMRYVEGEALGEPIARARAGEPVGDLPLHPQRRSDLNRLLAFFERAARGLHAAHVEGVVHRDVKPGNIAVSLECEPVLLDFGLARDAEDPDQVLTRSGDIFGTPLYMSPEQVRGVRDLDARTDVFSLGVCLYEALTLERPFRGDTRLELELAILEKPLPDPRQHNVHLPPELLAVLETAMERDRSRRYSSALEFAEDLRRLREYEPVHARTAGPLLRLKRWVQRQPVLATALLAVLLSLVGGLVQQQRALEKERDALRRAEGSLLAIHSRQQVDVDPGAALGLALAAVERYPSEPTLSALYPSLRACQLERVLDAREGAHRVWDASLSPGGDHLAGIDGDTLRLWSFPWGELLHEVDCRERQLCKLTFSPAGDQLVLGTLDGHLGFLDGREPRDVEWRPVGSSAIVWLEFDGKGERLLVLEAGGEVRVIDAETRETLAAWSVDPGRYSRASFVLGDTGVVLGRQLAFFGSALADPMPGGLVLFDATNGGLLSELGHHGQAQLDFDLDGAGARAASVGQDGRVLLHDLERRETREVLRVAGEARCVAFHPSGRRLAVGTDEAGGGPHLAVLEPVPAFTTLGGPPRSVSRVSYSPDGQRIVTLSGERRDPTLFVHDLETKGPGRVLRSLFRHPDALWSPDGRRLVSFGNSPYMHVWHAGSTPHFYGWQHGASVCFLSFVNEGRELAVGGEAGLRIHATPIDAQADPGRPLWEAGDGEVWLARAAGERVVTLGGDQRLRTYDLSRRQTLATSEPLPAPVRRLSIDEEGTLVLALLEDRTAWLFPFEGSEPARLLAEDAAAGDLRGDGLEVALGGCGRSLRLLDLDGGVLARPELHAFPEETFDVTDLLYRPDGLELAAACSDKSLRFLEEGEPREGAERLFQPHAMTYRPQNGHLLVWGRLGASSVRWIDVSQRKQSFFEGTRHGGRLFACALEPESGTVATGAEDGGVFLWNEQHGLSVRMLEHGAPITALALTPSRSAGARVASADASGQVFVWPADPYEAALERKPRELAAWDLPAWFGDLGPSDRAR